jgi:hypothetical protein
MDSLRYHPAQFDGEYADGDPICGLCTYPLVPTKEDKARNEKQPK